MSDHSWGEIFNLNEELKRIEEEVDKRLEETLAADPHVIEQETVHYGSPDTYRMRQSMPTFETPAPAEPEIEAPAAEEPVAPAEVTESVEEEPTAPAEEAVSVEEEAAIPAEEVESVEEEAATPAEEAESVEEEAAAPVEEEETNVIAFPTAEPVEEPVEEPAEEITETTEEPATEESVTEESATEEVAAEEPAAEEITEEPATEEPSAKTPEAAPEAAVDQPAAETPAQETPAETSEPADNRRKILIALVAAIVVLAAILGGLYWNGQQKPKAQYESAQALLDAGDYDGAIEAFTATHGYKDSTERILEAQYAKAESLVDAGAYGDAVDYIDSLSSPTDAMKNLRASAIYQTAVQDYAEGNLDVAVSELGQIEDYETNGISAKGLLNQIRYQQASDALAIYDFDAAEPILEALGDYEDASVLLWQVQRAIDIVYTDVARDDDGVEIQGKSEYLWVHSVITPGQIAAGSTEDEIIAALREIGCATDDIDDDAVKVLMMQQATTDAEMLYIDADPIKTDKADVITMDISQYAGVDETFGEDQILYSPQTLQRSNTDYTFAFEGSEAYAGKPTEDTEDEDADDDGSAQEQAREVRMECKMADDGYWVKTRRVYDEMENGKLVGVPQHQLRTWTKVTSEGVADEVRSRFLAAE